MARIIGLVFLAAAELLPQSMPSVGDFRSSIHPRYARIGQTVAFQALRFDMCQYAYEVTYTLRPMPISSRRTARIELKAEVHPECATASGYSGPAALFGNLQPGKYLLSFDSTSDFKHDLGDSGFFFVSHPELAMGVSQDRDTILAPGLGPEEKRRVRFTNTSDSAFYFRKLGIDSAYQGPADSSQYGAVGVLGAGPFEGCPTVMMQMGRGGTSEAECTKSLAPGASFIRGARLRPQGTICMLRRSRRAPCHGEEAGHQPPKIPS